MGLEVLMEYKKCGDCGDIVYGSREREAAGYRAWWEQHICEPEKLEVKYRIIKEETYNELTGK